jgi:predicted lactoylglutathione lyase
MTTRNRKLFVNLSVRDLERSVAFFTKLGFHFDAKFTDEKGTCMPLGEDAFVMLLEESRFRDFTKQQICDTRTHTEGLFALSCSSRAEVDQLVKTALEAGARTAMDPQDHGFMYSKAIFDLDGHHWEIFWMDPAAMA